MNKIKSSHKKGKRKQVIAIKTNKINSPLDNYYLQENDTKHPGDDNKDDTKHPDDDNKDDTKHPEDDNKHPEDDTKHPEDDNKHPEDDTKHPDDDTKHPEDDNKHPEDDITYGITNEILTHCLKVAKKHIHDAVNESGDNSGGNSGDSFGSILRPVLDKIMNTIINKIAPYLYSIMAILIVMFFMNCFQFYYYIKIILSKNVIKDTSFM